MKNSYEVYARTEYHPGTESGRPHTHEFHEIFMLLDGSVDFFVEGTKFPLHPGDLVLISAGDPHTKLVVNRDAYRCFVLYLACDFFTFHDCREYEAIFTRRLCTEHKISAETGKQSGFFDAFQRLENYTSGFRDTDNAITQSLLIEMLHILNKKSEFSSSYVSNPQVQQILEYINNHSCNQVTLSSMAETLYLSKYYICKIFKKYTGYTVNQYLTQKRIARAAALVREGQTITSACINAGFADYSSFYKAYKKQTGAAPKHGLKPIESMPKPGRFMENKE